MHSSITHAAIDPQAVLRMVGSPADGAAVIFLGTVREENESRRVNGMSYDAFVDMADPVLRDIAGEAARLAGTDRIAVVHRIGALDVGDVSVAIAVSSPHRAEAFEAARYIIEQIKQRLPVWKHEHYVDGESSWLAGVAPPGSG